MGSVRFRAKLMRELALLMPSVRCCPATKVDSAGRGTGFQCSGSEHYLDGSGRQMKLIWFLQQEGLEYFLLPGSGLAGPMGLDSSGAGLRASNDCR